MTAHIIKNWADLIYTDQRRRALTIMESGLDAVDTKRALARKVRRDSDTLIVGTQRYDLTEFDRIRVIGIGKAALDAAGALEEILDDRINDGIILDVRQGTLKRLTSIAGTHPLPSEANRRATAEIAKLSHSLSAHDLLIVIVSGGGSALLFQPHELSDSEMASLTEELLLSGATIQEINTVRKHTSAIQGGGLVQQAYPATVIGLLFSDIPGDDLSMIASGPTYLDTTTVSQAEKILVKYNVLKKCGLDNCNLHETPKEPKFFAQVHNELIVNNGMAADAMVAEAKKQGYIPQRYSTTVAGEAREIGQLLASLPKPKEAVIAAGETTVTVTKVGEGGRNLEVALGALAHPQPNSLVISLASDGRDNVPVAGAIADADTARKAKELSLSAVYCLDNNCSYDLFKQTGDLIRTGPTGRNVSDLMLALND
jgi:glycerate 2-kinase